MIARHFRPKRSRPAGRHLGLAVGFLCVLVASCRTQRWVGPLEPITWPLPAGAGTDYLPGLEEVVVIRHSDPVAVRRAGANATFPLSSLNRRERVRSGAWVVTRAGGHAEVFWPLLGTTVLFNEEGALRVGEAARGEPSATFERLTRATVKLAPGVRIALPTGAVLSGDETRESGPYSLEARFPNILRVSNVSKTTAFLAYRRDVMPLGPGQSVDLALLDAGTAPREPATQLRRFVTDSFAVDLEGSAQVRELGPGLAIDSTGSGRVRGLGVTVELGLDRSALFLPLGHTFESFSTADFGTFDTPAVDASGTEGPQAGEPELDGTGAGGQLP